MATQCFHKESEVTMTVSAYAFSGPGTSLKRQRDARRDLRRRAIVDDGLAVLVSSNMMCAFEYLRAHDIAADIIARVLLERLRRRPRA